MRLKNKSTLRHCAAVKKGGLMLEMIMKLNIPLYVMTSMGCIGGLGMLATNLTYRRLLKSTGSRKAGSKNGGITGKVNLKEKWLNLWKTRDRLLHRMNRLVWYPALISIALLGLAVYFSTVLKLEEGLPLTYLYVGATLPVALLLLRQALDFSYKEEEVIDRITSSIKQTAASGSHFSKMLTPEEEKIMREIIREFMA